MERNIIFNNLQFYILIKLKRIEFELFSIIFIKIKKFLIWNILQLY